MQFFKFIILIFRFQLIFQLLLLWSKRSIVLVVIVMVVMIVMMYHYMLHCCPWWKWLQEYQTTCGQGKVDIIHVYIWIQLISRAIVWGNHPKIWSCIYLFLGYYSSIRGGSSLTGPSFLIKLRTHIFFNYL